MAQINFFLKFRIEDKKKDLHPKLCPIDMGRLPPFEAQLLLWGHVHSLAGRDRSLFMPTNSGVKTEDQKKKSLA